LKEIEKRSILQTLESENGNVIRGAQRLGMHRSSLYSKIREYGLKAPADAQANLPGPSLIMVSAMSCGPMRRNSHSQAGATYVTGNLPKEGKLRVTKTEREHSRLQTSSRIFPEFAE
jgi:transposase-like protein